MGSKVLATKNCVVCGREFNWRKKWERNWDSIKFCSDACRRSAKTLDDHYEKAILNLLNQRARGATICPSEVLAADQKQNKSEMEKVRQAARRLVHDGQIEITQKGHVVDPSEFCGPIRLKMKN